jgi:hypothetical protein
MNKRTLLAAGFAAITISSTAYAGNYVVGSQGDTWTYSNESTSEITATSGTWRKFSDFANMGEQWIYSGSNSNYVYYWDGSTHQVFANLGANIGTTFSVSESMCYAEELEITAKNTTVETDAGTFTDTVTISCGDRETVFAKDMGIVKQFDTQPQCFTTPCYPWHASLKHAVVDGVVYGSVEQPPVENQAPDANADSASTAYETAVTIDVLANDTDNDGSLNASTVTVTLDAQHGTTSVNADGSITYTPNASYSGADDFAYSVQDNEAATSDSVLVSVTVGNAPTQGGGNQALDATASATSIYTSSYTASNVNDGDTYSNWYSNYIYSYGSVEVELNWNDARSLNFLEIEWVGNYFPNAYDVYYKKNGYWTLLEQNVRSTDAANLSVTTTGIKIKMTNDRNSGYMGIYEIVVE